MIETIIFEPVRTTDEILKEIVEIKNKLAILKIKESKLIDELVKTNHKENVHADNKERQ
jgi:hypothetical protein